MSSEAIRLGIVLGGAGVAFLLFAYGISRLQRALADDAVSAAIRPYRLPTSTTAHGWLAIRSASATSAEACGVTR